MNNDLYADKLDSKSFSKKSGSVAIKGSIKGHKQSIESVEYNKSMASDNNALKVNMDANNPSFDIMISYLGEELDQGMKKLLRKTKMQKRRTKLYNIEDHVPDDQLNKS